MHSCPIIITVTIIILGLGSTNEQEHVTFDRLNLTSLSMMISSSAHFPANDIIQFFFMAE
jgi:hypothetical protein